MKKKLYKSIDKRTGYEEGMTVSLSEEELIKTPFNVFLEKIPEEKEKEETEKTKNIVEKEELRKLLEEKGLSKGRTKKVIEKFTLEELQKGVANPGIDPITDNWINKEFGKKLTKKEK